MSKSLVQQQFGDKAEAYASSPVHAKGASLDRMVELIEPQADWVALDVATAAGHMGHRITPHIRFCIGSDITPSMLPKALKLAAEKGLPHFQASAADAEALPFKDESLDLVTCRIAPHHFPDIPRFVQEAYRTLKPGGILAVTDNIVPSTGSHKKRDRVAYANAADFINSFEKLRDPSHAVCFSLHQWKSTFAAAGFSLLHTETMRKKMAFEPWAERMRVAPDDKIRLRAMLTQPPELVQAFLTPEFEGDKIEFYLTEGIIIGKK